MQALIYHQIRLHNGEEKKGIKYLKLLSRQQWHYIDQSTQGEFMTYIERLEQSAQQKGNMSYL